MHTRTDDTFSYVDVCRSVDDQFPCISTRAWHCRTADRATANAAAISRRRARRILEIFMLLSAMMAMPNTTNGQEIFSDGFESGDALQWSSQVPPAASADGTYQFAVYDSLQFASGGNLVIEDGIVETINGTYFNFDKVDMGGYSECSLILLWGLGLPPTAVGTFFSGVVFTDYFPDDPATLSVDESGEVTWTVTFNVINNVGFSGTLAAVGAGFSGDASGCNGTFPTLIFEGGKRNPGTQ